MWRRLALVLLAVSGCVAGSAPPQPDGTVGMIEPELPPGFPPKIGSVTADLGGRPLAWDTYDYSIGAFDSAVQIMGYNDELQFRIAGQPVGKPDEDTNRLFIKAVMTSPTQTGALTDAVIEIVAGKDYDGPRLTSVGSGAEVVLDSVIEKPEGAYGDVTGHFSAVLCAATEETAVVDKSQCQPIEGRFVSGNQFSNVERFR